MRGLQKLSKRLVDFDVAAAFYSFTRIQDWNQNIHNPAIELAQGVVRHRACLSTGRTLARCRKDRQQQRARNRLDGDQPSGPMAAIVAAYAPCSCKAQASAAQQR